MYIPEELIIHEKVVNDPVVIAIKQKCPNANIISVENGRPEKIYKASKLLQSKNSKMLDTIISGKQVMYIGPPGKVVDKFKMPDDRILCPHFDKFTPISNGCFYRCDWCFLKLTYRTIFPYISLKVGYDQMKKKLEKKLNMTNEPIIFNSGELADSLALEHLTGIGKAFIPWFAKSKKGYLFMLTKSDNVDGILKLHHNKRTIVAWSMNADVVSRKFELGTPTFQRRLDAAKKVQEAGYPLRIRLDPIVPIPSWRKIYSATIKKIFNELSPERITLGTLRFENNFHRMRGSIFSTGSDLKQYVDTMEPMFAPKKIKGKKSKSIGKYSFPEEQRVEIFRFAIQEIRRHSDCKIALCKEAGDVWMRTGLQASRCSCVCQLDYADMSL